MSEPITSFEEWWNTYGTRLGGASWISEQTALVAWVARDPEVAALRARVEKLENEAISTFHLYSNAKRCPSDNQCHQDCWDTFEESMNDLFTLVSAKQIKPAKDAGGVV
jgi:hypothetical protein